MLNIRLDKASGKPLYAQLRDGIAEAIAQKTLKPGDRLPPVAQLAADLNVAPSTIRRAMEDLCAAGKVHSHVGRGTFVAKAPTPAEANNAPSQYADGSATTTDEARRLRMGQARTLDALEAMAAKPGLIRFTPGVPPAESLRAGVLEELTNQAFKQGQDLYVNYSPTAGLESLRNAVAARFASAGAEVSPEQVLITNGSQQAVSLLAQAALADKPEILCEMPCYMGIPRAFGAVGHWVTGVLRDADGPRMDQLAKVSPHRPAMLYLCPELHNPTGCDLHPIRRKALIDWAGKGERTLISDEVFCDLRFDGSRRPSLLADAGTDRTVVMGSLSKSFMCGLRIGWVVSSRQRIQSLLALKKATDIGCPPLTQGIAIAALESSEYDDHVRRVRRLYQIRCNAALGALKKYMPDGVTWTRPAGGFHLWAQLPRGYSALALFVMCLERGVTFGVGPQHDIDHRFNNAMRLSYGSVRPERIDKGIRLIGEACEELLRRRPRDFELSGPDSFT